MKCLVTGATGFVGRQLCSELSRRQHEVIALSRRGGELPGGMATQACDLALAPPSPARLAGVGVLYHLAGIAHRSAAAADYEAVNYRATVSLARQAARAGVACFVFLSSVSAMGRPDSASARREGDGRPPDDAYGGSKWRAECALREEFAGAAMSVVILRPTLMYGPSVQGNLARLARAARRGLPRPPDGGRRSLLAVDDLVALLCQFAEQPPGGTHTWIVSGEDYSTRELVDMLRAAIDGGRARQWLPPSGWRLACWLLDRLAGKSDEATYSRLFGSELYDHSALSAATGWQPRTGFGDLAADMVRVSQQC